MIVYTIYIVLMYICVKYVLYNVYLFLYKNEFMCTVIFVSFTAVSTKDFRIIERNKVAGFVAFSQ